MADFYTHLYPVAKGTVERKPLFDALCTVSVALGMRWRKDGGFLLGRSASFLWDKLKEVPNRYLQRWAQDRDSNGGLPLADFLEMTSMTDRQLNWAPVAMGIERYWGLPEWHCLRNSITSEQRQQARCLALLPPDQQRRALEPEGLPFRDVAPAQQQAIMQRRIRHRGGAIAGDNGRVPLDASRGLRRSLDPGHFIVPAGWYVAQGAAGICLSEGVLPWDGPMEIVGGRTAARRPPRRANASLALPRRRFAAPGMAILPRGSSSVYSPLTKPYLPSSLHLCRQ